MTDAWTQDTANALAKRLREAEWLTGLRQQALERHSRLPWPHPSDDIWRRTDISLLDPAKGFQLATTDLLHRVTLSEAQLAAFAQPLGGEELAVRANGEWVRRATGGRVAVRDLGEAVDGSSEPLRSILEADGLSEAEQKLASLNEAFHHDDVVVDVPAGVRQEAPVRLVHLVSAVPQTAVFPLTIIRAGAGSQLTLIDEYVSLGPQSHEPHLLHGRIELVLEPDAVVHYVRLQRLGQGAREFLLQRATLGQGAQLRMANINLGAAVSKAHVITRFNGPHASSRLYGFVFGQHTQHVDQHTLQDHRAPHTSSDLEVRAALQHHSRLVYTGLIRIGTKAVQTEAYQSNHNLLLSDDAKAETIPMLEILADDVQCKHGASAGPIDEDQIFYLMSRGLARSPAERLIVMGFVEPMVQQVPFEPLQQRLREEIDGSLAT